MKVPSFAVLLHCRSCGHDHLETKLAVDLMKFHPTCVKCRKPVEIIRPEDANHEQPNP